ncbi:hypothetical protein Sste5346_007006 [Sporothrix stenoceras]|uniref:Proteophosphoglycan ppg4 n=1 Tax=Sporothrix stenoceras TaxID=5173 RepID=A0ABR3YX68_9PEZI
MGLMTLLARKINPEKNQPQLRAPTYERKISTKSPVRLVQTVSPSGSTTNIHGSHATSKSSSNDVKPRQYPSSPLSQASFSTDSAAPAPVILGFRGDDLPSRPATSQPAETSQRPQPRSSLLVAPRPRVAGTQSPVPKASAPSKAHSHRPQSSVSSSKFARSIRTDVSQKGYVDLLDAQSEFKPADFYTRVKAAGTRDYGEDVADRNIGVNGCNLDSQPVQAFYAVRPKTANRSSMLDQRRPFSSWNRSAKFNEEDENNVYQPHVTKQSSIDSALRSKSLNSSHQALFSHGNAAPVLSARSLEKNRDLQRQAYSNAMPPYSASTYSTPSLADIEALHEHQRQLNRKMKGRSLQVSVRDANGLVSAWDTTSPESDDEIADRPSTSGGMSRRVSGASKRGGHALSGFEQSDDGPRYGVNNQPILSPQPTSFRLSASLASSAFTTSNKRPTSMHNNPSVRRSQQQQPAFESHNTAPDLSNLPLHLKEKARNFKEDWHDDLTDRESAPSPFIKTSRSRSQSRENMREIYNSGANIVTTPRPLSQPGEPQDHTPGHTNSIRHWSMASTAPTISSSSSATYGRPHSRHTTNTSIDLSTTGPPSTGDATSKGQSSQRSDAIKRSLAALQSPMFNIDDYVSSDDDSFIASQAERSASEEDLLFNSGYGKMGIQLPGLEDAFAVPAPISLVRSPRMSAPKQNEDFRRAFGEPPLMTKLALRQMASDDSLNSNPGQRRRLSSGVSGTANVRKSNSREELNATSSPVKRTETKRMSALLGSSSTHHGSNGGALGSHSLLYNPRPNPRLAHGSNVGGQVIEEERFEKVDVATAVRLRKEAKSKKRASMMSIASQTRGRGMVKTVSIESRKTGNSNGNIQQEANIKAVRQKAIVSSAPADIANVPELIEDHEHTIESDDE